MNQNFSKDSSRTDRELVLLMLRRGERLTRLKCHDHIGTMALNSRICDLRKRGWPIEDRFIDAINRRGKPVRVKEFWMKPDAMPGEQA